MELIPALRLGLDPHTPDVVAVVGGGGKTSLVFRLAQAVAERGLRVVSATTTRVSARQIELAPTHLRLHDDALPLDDLARALDAHGHCLLLGTATLLNGKQTGVSPAVIDRLAAHAAALGIAAIVVEADGSRTLPVKAPGAHEPVVPSATTLLLPVVGMDAIGAPLDDAHAHRPEQLRALLGLDDAPTRLTPAQAAHLLLHPAGGAKGRPQAARLLPVFNKADAAPRLAAARLAAAAVSAQQTPALVAAAGNAASTPVLERWGPVAVILLAAGASSRFGSPKQLAQVEGEPLVLRAARLALAGGAQQVIVVTGAHADVVTPALSGLAHYLRAGALRIVHNPDWAQGQSTSLRAGIAALPPATEAVLCLPVDQPFVPAALLRRMITLWRSGADLVAPQVEGAAAGVLRGAPALFDRNHFAALAAVTGDQGGRTLLRQLPATPVPARAADLADIDRPEDWRG